MNKFLTMTSLAAVLALPIAAHAQGGAATGAATGAVGGAIVGGPVGAVVGAGVGAVAGGIADDSRPRFRSYVTQQKVPSYRYTKELRVGADLPSSGVTYYDVAMIRPHPETFWQAMYSTPTKRKDSPMPWQANRRPVYQPSQRLLSSSEPTSSCSFR